MAVFYLTVISAEYAQLKGLREPRYSVCAVLTLRKILN